MRYFAIELDDRALSLARDGRVLASSCSAVFDGSGRSAAGANAWSAVRSQPMAASTRHLGSVLCQRDVAGRANALVAKELATRLAANPINDAEHVWVAAPARVGPGGLGALLGIARNLSLPVDGFVDSAVASVAALELHSNAVVVEIGLHHVAATAVDAEAGHARRRRSVLCERGGAMELYGAWLDMVSTTMVKRTRFDPLHDAATEQALFDSLPDLARQTATHGSASALLSSGAAQFEVTLTRDQFAQAGEPVYREIAGAVHELRPAGSPMALVMPRELAAFPGIREKLEQYVGCELVLLTDGFAAAAASLLDLPARQNEEPVRLLRRLPLQPRSELVGLVSREPLGTRRSSGPPPSHVLLDGRAYSLGSAPLVVGRAPGAPDAAGVGVQNIPDIRSLPDARGASGAGVPGMARSITLPEGLAGVSRRHCTFAQDSGGLILLDHSTFGTFVNGERIAERVRVYAGDRVKLGDPGVELALIAVGDVTAAA